MNTIFYWLQALFSRRNYTLRNYTVFLLVLFCIQYIPVESRAGVSWVKVGVMAITACMMLKYTLVNKALIIALLYALWIMMTAYALHPATFRASTVIYFFMFLITFVAFYTFVWNYHVFSLDFFIKVVRGFIFVLVGVLVAQQICIIIGFRLMPILNLCQILDRGIGANSLTFEPSTLGRLINILFYAYLKCIEYRRGETIKITEILNQEHKWVTIAFLWAVLTMGSGTAFFATAITSLYFMKGWKLLYSVPIFLIAYFAMDFFGNESFRRVQRTTRATMTGDAQLVMETDGSAATRIKPLLNTLTLDLTDPDVWIGRGCDSAKGLYSDNRYIVNIGDYGFISFVICVIFTFKCAVSFWSLPTIMILVGVAGFAGGNVSYVWGLLMIFTCVTYFKHHRNENQYFNIED